MNLTSKVQETTYLIFVTFPKSIKLERSTRRKQHKVMNPKSKSKKQNTKAHRWNTYVQKKKKQRQQNTCNHSKTTRALCHQKDIHWLIGQPFSVCDLDAVVSGTVPATANQKQTINTQMTTK